MAFSLSGGLSEMGKTIANTAGDLMLSEQRSLLERDRIRLAEQLAEGREARSDVRKGMINAAAAEKEQAFRASEGEKNRGHEVNLATMREAGDDRRAKMSNDRMAQTAAISEAGANRRFNAEMELRVKEAKERATDKEEQRILNSVIAAATSTVEQPYTTASGATATRPVKVFNPEKAAGLLRDAGYDKLAAPFAPKKARRVNVDGKPRPPLESFLNGK